MPISAPTSARSRPAALLPYLAHLAVVLFVFAPVLFEGRMLFLRDVSAVYYPDYVFLHDALRHGVWPLWNPTSDAGAPFLMPYPVMVALVACFGPQRALALGPALHVLLAMCGTTALSRRRGGGPWGAWLAGAILGLSGYVQSSLLFPVFLAAAWAPFVLLAYDRLRETPSPRATAALGALVALQLSTFGGELVMQTLLLGLFLGLPRSRRSWAALVAAGLLAGLLAAPVLLGSRAMLAGSARGAGFSPDVGLSFSAPVPVLLEALLPRFLGDPHTFSDYGFWGQSYFPEGYPFFLSLYLGPLALLLALRAGRDRLWLLAGLGVLASLGAHGPLAELLVPLMRTFRVPVKFFFLTTFAIALLAGRGLDRSLLARRSAWSVALPGLLLLGLSALLWRDPGAPARLLGSAWPGLLDWRAQVVASLEWPTALLRTGALCLAAGLALAAGRRLAPLAGVAVVFDLLIVAAPLNPVAEPEFYALRPEMRSLLRQASSEGPYRWFSCGLKAVPPVRFDPGIAVRNRDYWLYAMERQSLLPRTHVLDGLEGAYDEDRTGLSPAGATLPTAERDPALLARYYRRLRLANVRFVISYRPLPPELVSLRGRVAFREVLDPLLLYELRDPLPRAYWVGEHEVAAGNAAARLEEPGFDAARRVLLHAPPPVLLAVGGAAGPADVRFELVDPHTVRLRAKSPPGFVVVSMGYDRAWQAEGPDGPSPLLRANGRYWALPTPGGEREWLVRYRPSWLPAALGLAALGALAAIVLSLASGRAPGIPSERLAADTQ